MAQPLQFAVVEFIDDDPVTIGVVPQCWLYSSGDNLFSYWPKNNISVRARKSEQPDVERWTEHAVRPMKYTDSYDLAVSLAKVGAYTSNLSEEEDQERKLKGKRKKEDFEVPDNDADDCGAGSDVLKKNNVLALFSLRGQKGKKAFQKLALYKTITRAVSKSKNCKRVEIDDALIEVLKHAPHMPGGPKYKKRRSTAAVELTDSDSD